MDLTSFSTGLFSRERNWLRNYGFRSEEIKHVTLVGSLDKHGKSQNEGLLNQKMVSEKIIVYNKTASER